MKQKKYLSKLRTRSTCGERPWRVVGKPEQRIRSVRKALAPGEIGRPGEEVSRRQRYPPAARFRLHRPRRCPTTSHGIYSVLLSLLLCYFVLPYSRFQRFLSLLVLQLIYCQTLTKIANLSSERFDQIDKIRSKS